MRIKRKTSRLQYPARVIVLGFAIIVAIGTVWLMMPFCSRDGRPTPFLNALFTATSATCVTGLVVYDTFTKWTMAGQLGILLMIQTGGLGFITFTTFFNSLIGRKIGMRSRYLAQESVSSSSMADITKLIRVVVVASLSFETIGACLLSTVFVPKYGVAGLYISIFLSVSAFCNAGFDVLGMEGEFSSVMHYNDNPIVLITLSLLVIIGGLGFIVWQDLSRYRKERKLELHTKIVLVMTGALIVIGAVFFLTLEWDNTMRGMSVPQKLLSSFFQSVTTRTAGFNSLDFAAMYDETKLGTIFLMFIGGAPGSTAGGIKVTTLAVLVMTVVSVIQGKEDTVILGRKVEKSVVYKALAVVVIAFIAIVLSSGIIYFTGSARGEIASIDALFESVSAFATVGISVGVSGIANLPSRLFLILTMFMGRVGPVSLALSLAMRAPESKMVVLPEGKIMVG